MSSSPPINEKGCCPIHPVIQLQRKQRRTGEWKVILSSCPLCVSGLPPMESTGGGGEGGGGVESPSRGERDRDRDGRDRASRTPSAARERKSGRLQNSINNYVSDDEFGGQDTNNYASNNSNNNNNNSRAPHSYSHNHRNDHIDNDQEDEGDEESSIVSHSSRLSHYSRHSVSSQATFKQRGGGRSAQSSRPGDRGSPASHEAWLMDQQQQQQQQQQLGVRFHPETKGPSEKGNVPIDGEGDNENDANPPTASQGDDALAAAHHNKPAMPPSVLKPSKFGPSAATAAVNSSGNSTGGDVGNGGGMRTVTSNNNFHDDNNFNNGPDRNHMNSSNSNRNSNININTNSVEEPPEDILPPGYENCLVPYEPDSNGDTHHGDGPFDSSINSLEGNDGPLPTYYEDRDNASAPAPNSSFMENNNRHIDNDSRYNRDPSVHGSINSAASGSGNGKQYPPPPPKHGNHNQNTASPLNTPNPRNTPNAANNGGDNMDMDYCREVAGGPPRPPNGNGNNNTHMEEHLHSSIQSNISSSYHTTSGGAGAGAGAGASIGRRDRDQSRQRDRDQSRQSGRDQSRPRDRSRGRDGGRDQPHQPGPPPPRSRSRSRSKSRGATRGASVGRSGNAHPQMTPQPQPQSYPSQPTPQSAPPSILRSESRTRTRDRSESRSRGRDAPPPQQQQQQHHHHSSGNSVNSSNRPAPPPPAVPSLPNHYRGGMDPQDYNHPGQDADEYEDDEEEVFPMKQQHIPVHPHDRMNQYPPGQGPGGNPRGPPPPNSGIYRGDPRGDPNCGNYNPHHHPQQPYRRDSAPQPMDRRMRGQNIHRQGPRGGEPPVGSNFPPGSFQSPAATFPNNNNNNNRMPKAPNSAPVHFPSRNNNNINGNDNSSQMSEGSRRQSMQHQYQHNQQHSDQGPAPPPINRPGSAPGPKQRKTATAKDSSTIGQTESETQPEEDSEIDQTDSDSFLPMAKASEYDEKGRCVKHPHIKLRKKKMLGGWKVLLVNCPDCCIEEMLKMRKSGADKAAKANAKSNGGADNRRPAQRRGSKGEESESSGLPPISQLTISHRKKSSNNGGADDENQSASSGSASEITYGTKTDFSRFSAGGSMSWQNYSGDHSGSTPGSGPHRVTRMPFTDAYGDRGWYTGDVASGSGLPSGIGTMHYVDGRVRQGRWSNGLADDGPPNQGGNRRISSGNSVNSNDNYNRSRHPPPPSSGNSVGSRKSKVVCGMQWTDYRGNSGFFTGETDDDGEPNGMGSMRYHSGEVLEGKWTHGQFDGRGGGGGRSVSSSSKGGRVRV